jgi:hypothetical protein
MKEKTDTFLRNEFTSAIFRKISRLVRIRRKLKERVSSRALVTFSIALNIAPKKRACSSVCCIEGERGEGAWESRERVEEGVGEWERRVYLIERPSLTVQNL